NIRRAVDRSWSGRKGAEAWKWVADVPLPLPLHKIAFESMSNPGLWSRRVEERRRDKDEAVEGVRRIIEEEREGGSLGEEEKIRVEEAVVKLRRAFSPPLSASDYAV